MLEVQGPLVLSEAGVPISATPQSHIQNLFGCPLYFLVLECVIHKREARSPVSATAQIPTRFFRLICFPTGDQ